ncbi:unnamed protein product [Spirodela intermedia]|uniref:Uncharacterized protein n=1 Tax=Spirodela intermedia TaxID=51605 RepID=A0A7I8KF18_SPIIN|nr:unnamed protein product [Spirodela intermedia]
MDDKKLVISPKIRARARPIREIMKTAAVPHYHLPPITPGRQLHELMAVLADSEVLNDPNGAARLGAQQPEGKSQLLTVKEKRPLPLFRAHILQHGGKVGDHLIDLSTAGMVAAAGEELVHLAADLDRAAPGLLLDAFILHRPPHQRSVLPPLGLGVHIGQQDVIPAALGVQLCEAEGNVLGQFDISMDPAGAQKRRPNDQGR